MSEEELPISTSPTLATSEGLMNSARDFSGTLTLDLTDDQIQAGWRVIQRIRKKHMDKFRRKFNDSSTFTLDEAMNAVEEFEDELKTTLAEQVGLLASVNTVPLLEGLPLEIEYLGVIEGHDLGKYGMDHEKKEYEVKKATERGEAFLGEHDG